MNDKYPSFQTQRACGQLPGATSDKSAGHKKNNPLGGTEPVFSSPRRATHPCKKPTANMGKDMRVTYKRRHSYHTKSNRAQPVKTPGGNLVLHTVAKRSKGPRCGDTGMALHGVSPSLPLTERPWTLIAHVCDLTAPMFCAQIKQMKTKQYKNVHKRERTVARAYGGSLCGQAVRDR